MRDDDSVLRWSSTAAAILLLTLCAITAITGVSQQRFEWVQLPDAYAAALVAQGGWLRAIVALDDLFIAAYVLATLALARKIANGRWGPVTVAIAVGGVAAGLLDLHENHDLMSMLRWTELGGALSPESIVERSDLSQLKWMIGHLAFVGVGASWPRRDGWLDKVLVASLIGVQLPIGALVWTLSDPAWIEVAIWARYGSFLSGFAVIAWMARPRSVSRSAPLAALGEAATGAPG